MDYMSNMLQMASLDKLSWKKYVVFVYDWTFVEFDPIGTRVQLSMSQYLFRYFSQTSIDWKCANVADPE